jgi:hypothetical protein
MVGLVGRSFPSKGGYDANFSGALVLRSFEKGDRSGGIPASAIADVEITPSLTNAYSTLHGGAIATLVRATLISYILPTQPRSKEDALCIICERRDLSGIYNGEWVGS